MMKSPFSSWDKKLLLLFGLSSVFWVNVLLARTRDAPAYHQDERKALETTIVSTTNTPDVSVLPKRTLWKNKFDVVHILSTRFMQLQPDLIHLGKARMELFKTFTLRSLREQSTQEFLWIIFTDPNLNSELLNELVGLVEIHPNILLIGSNVKFGGLRQANTTWIDSAAEHVFSGDIQMLKDYEEAAKTHLYVESRIDADDSMYQDFMKDVERQAVNSMKGNSKKQAALSSKTKELDFRVFCVEHHLEWGYFNPWHKESTKGHLFGITPKANYCITPGLTYVFQVGTTGEGIRVGHHRLHKTYPQCDESNHTKNCVDRIQLDPKYKYAALRSRTPTSVGMAGVIPRDIVKNSKHWEEIQEETWDTYILRNFGITPMSIWNLRAYFTNEMEHILQDALSGHCARHEFTCADGSKEALVKLLDQIHDQSGGSASAASVI